MTENERDPASEALMVRFLHAVEGYSNEEAGEKIGRTGEAVRKYRKGEWKRLEKATARKMRAFLRERPRPDLDGYRQGMLAAADEMAQKLDELRERATRSPEDDGLGGHDPGTIREALRPNGEDGHETTSGSD